MPTPVTQAPSAFSLDAVRTGEPVSVGTVARLAEEVAFLNGHNLVKTGEADAPLRQTGAGRVSLTGLAYTLRVPYTRSSGARVVRIAVEIHESSEILDSQAITVTLPTGATWLDAGGLDGTATFFNPPVGRTTPMEIVGFANVSGVTASLTQEIAVATTPTSKGSGVRRVTVHECPLSSLAVSSSEPGWDAAATRSGRPVIDGGSASPRGMQRLFHLLDQARSAWRQHWCLSGVESANASTSNTQTPHWHRQSSTEGEIDWLLNAAVNDPHWYLQVRDLYAGTASAWKLRVRYRTSSAVDCELKLYHQGGSLGSNTFTGVGTEGSTAVTLTATSGAWAWTTAVSVSLPRDGTNGLVRLRLTAKGPGSGELLSIACVDLREDEA